MSQRTSRPVSDGLARQIGRMFEDFARQYPAGSEKLEVVKGDPGLKEGVYRFFDEWAAKRIQALAIAERPAWKTIQLGTHNSVNQLRQALIDDGFKIGPWCDDIFKKITVAPKTTEIELVVVTVAELGSPNGATRQKIYDKALSLGLHLCPAEVGPQLRLQYLDQPGGEWLFVAMDPIADSHGSLCVFYVEHGSGSRWLRAASGDPDSFWTGDGPGVFCRK